MGVSKSGYYEYLGRRKPDQQMERGALEGFVEDVFLEHKSRYGHRRTYLEPGRIGIVANEKRVLKIVREKGPEAMGTTRRYRIQKRIEKGDPRADLVERVSAVSGRNRLWVGDITYVPTRRGFLYLATVMDAFSRKVVGWSMATHMRENLVMDALEQAVGRESPSGHDLVFHDDQGTRYTSRASRKALGRHGITQSVSRPGNPYGNAVVEPFLETPRTELVKGQAYEGPEEARQEAFKYIEPYHDTERMHSTLGYMSPCDFERQST